MGTRLYGKAARDVRSVRTTMAEPETTRNIITTGDIRPIPDPTALTSALVEAGKEELRREVAFVRDVIEARFDAMDKAIVLLQTMQDRIPQRMGESLMQLQHLTDERFNTQQQKFLGIETQFTERDTRMDQAATATKIAVDAALQAQKEAVGAQNANIAQAMARIEATATKQIEQLITLLQTTAAASNDKIDDLKQRLALIEGRTAGITTATSTQREGLRDERAGGQYTLAIVGFVSGALLGLVGIVMAILKR